MHRTFISLLALVFFTSPLPTFAQSKPPVKMIFDTDMGNDIDDAMALAMIHQLARRSAVELLAVTSTKDHPKSVAYIDALNTWYGFPDLPLGAVRDGAAKEEGRYNGQVDRKDPGGRPLFPHDLDGTTAPEAVSLIRKTLAAQPDGSVMLVQVGFFTNFARLLDSKGDDASPLDGPALIRAKVKELVIMAGAFQTIKFNTKHIEYNVKLDVPSAKRIATDWPSPVIWSGYEIGIAAAYPWKSIAEDYAYAEPHLIKDSYLAYVPQQPHDRPTWDLTAALYAIYPDRGYFDLSPRGHVHVDDEGRTDFRERGDGNDRYLLMNAVQTEKVREAFVQLCSEPPAGG
jgi:inosine-uridine nucleoside N-ribohydrolase